VDRSCSGSRLFWLLCVAIGLALVLAGTSQSYADSPTSTALVSVDINGRPGDRYSAVDAISAGGRWVAFHSEANDLIKGDTNRTRDVFVRDVATGKTIRVSVTSDGNQVSFGGDAAAAISPDGQTILFTSEATDLVPGKDVNQHFDDLFVRDLKTGTTSRVDVRSDGRQLPCADFDADYPTAFMSQDTQRIIFETETGPNPAHCTGPDDGIFMHNRLTGRTRRLVPKLKANLLVGVSPGGRYLAVLSDRRGTAWSKLTIRDRYRSRNIPVSTRLPRSLPHRFNDEAYFSNLGRQLAFATSGGVYIFTQKTGEIEPGYQATDPRRYNVTLRGISLDGRYITVITNDRGRGIKKGHDGILRIDRRIGIGIRVDLGSDSKPLPTDVWIYHAAMSSDGSAVAFTTPAGTLPAMNKRTCAAPYQRAR
jgi:dipeptidyl aminopeptidase/acylaminoacyl peptidase